MVPSPRQCQASYNLKLGAAQFRADLDLVSPLVVCLGVCESARGVL
jgi:hypothetical protein